MNDEIKQRIAAYRPSEQAIDTLRKQKLIIFAGIAGAGKNSIMDGLLKTGKYHDIVTSTTRAPRENNGVMEQDGIDYHFLSIEQAAANLEAGEYIEVAPVHGRVNGILVKELELAQKTGKIPIVDIDIKGVSTIKSLSDDVIAIFVVPPSYKTWMERFKRRYDSEAAFLEVWPDRRESAILELREALEKPYYHFLINEDLDQAIKSAEAIITHGGEFSQIDTSYHVWVEKILSELEAND